MSVEQTTETYPERMATSPPSRPWRRRRRRQRSVRVTVAVVLLSVATLVVVLALPTRSAGWLSASSVTALLCGFAAARIIYNELVQSRREAATDRAAQAQAYRSMFVERAEEHAAFTTAMTERLAARDRSIRDFEGTVVLAEKRAMEAESRVKREARRAVEAQEKVAELQQALEIRTAEEADELATWEGWEADTVVDLLTWDEKVVAGAPAADEAQQQQHA